MVLYKLTNLLTTAVIVEDLGVRMEPRGSATVRAEDWARSNDGARLESQGCVRVDRQFSPSTGPAPRPIPAVRHPEAAPDPKVSIVNLSQASFDQFLRNQEELLRMLVVMSGSVPDAARKAVEDGFAKAGPPSPPPMAAHQPHATPSALKDDAPMYIPSKIVPDVIVAGVKSQVKESDSSVDDSADALRRLRNKG